MADNPLIDLIGAIESNNNPSAAGGGEFQQQPLFVEQFGSGAGGVQNFITQALHNNPNITVGDLYAEYNADTGHPGRGPQWNQLSDINHPAFKNALNKMSSAGVSPGTPVANLLGQSAAAAAPTPQINNLLSPTSAPSGPSSVAVGSPPPVTINSPQVADSQGSVSPMTMLGLLKVLSAGTHQAVGVNYDPWKIAGLMSPLTGV